MAVFAHSAILSNSNEGQTMRDDSNKNDSDLPAGQAKQHNPANDFDWHRRAGPIFRWGLATGFVLILIGGLFWGLSLVNTILAILIICSGLGIILGAFGSTASVTIPGQSIVLIGVAGLAGALFVLILAQMDNRYVLVKIGGNINAQTQMSLVGDRDYLGGYQKSEKTYDFVIFGKDIKRSHLELYVVLPSKELPPFDCIPVDTIRPHLASGDMIEWRLNVSNDDDSTLLDEKSGEVIAKSPCRQPQPFSDIRNGSMPSLAQWALSGFGLISTASAEPAANDLQALIGQLESDVLSVRRDARSQLAGKGIQVVDPLLSALSAKNLSYRSRLGIIVALTEMMRDNKADRDKIIGLIKKESLPLLLDAVKDEDRTIRIYASEFLYDLGDPRVLPLALDRFSAANEDGRYNLLLVIKGAVPYAPDALKRELAQRVTALKSDGTPKTNLLIDSIISLALGH